tara:strand:+ start:9791 stop:10741 length:951 start_codon:yes stop_codon:yes gene_type:complete
VPSLVIDPAIDQSKTKRMKTPADVRAGFIRALNKEGLQIRDADLKTSVGKWRRDGKRSSGRHDVQIYVFGKRCRSEPEAVRMVRARALARPIFAMAAPPVRPRPGDENAVTTASAEAGPETGLADRVEVGVNTHDAADAPEVDLAEKIEHAILMISQSEKNLEQMVQTDANNISAKCNEFAQALESLKQRVADIDRKTENYHLTHSDMLRDVNAKQRGEHEKMQEKIDQMQAQLVAQNAKLQKVAHVLQKHSKAAQEVQATLQLHSSWHGGQPITNCAPPVRAEHSHRASMVSSVLASSRRRAVGYYPDALRGQRT